MTHTTSQAADLSREFYGIDESDIAAGLEMAGALEDAYHAGLQDGEKEKPRKATSMAANPADGPYGRIV